MKAKINDILRFLSSVTILKIINSVFLRVSFRISILGKKTYVWGKPESISIEPINLCNLHCPECPTGTDSLKRAKGSIDFNLYKQIINDGKKYLYNVILYFQGEPFLSVDIFKQISFAKQNSIYTSTSTNGHYLDKETCEKIVNSGLDRLIISLDGIDAETYNKYRVGGNFEKVISGIKQLEETKKRLKKKHPFTIIQFLVFSHNQHQISGIKQLVKDLGVSKLEIKTAQISNNSSLNTDLNNYSRYEIKKEGLFIKSKLPNKCKRMWNSVVVTVDGNISPCCFDKDGEHSYGNYSGINFKNIRKHKNYINFSNRIITNRRSIDICTNCTEGLKI